MRRTRPLLLLAILAILGVVGVLYNFQKKVQESQAPPAPQTLPEELSAKADYWSWSHTVEGRPVVEVRARNYRAVREPSRFDLDDVELRLFDKEGGSFDQVKSKQAHFDIANGVLYSDGEVRITLGVPADESPAGRLVFIRTSGATFEARTGKASTDRPATFTFDQGEGKSVGASYDPDVRELRMLSHAEVTWRGRGPNARPMKVEAGELVYKERDSAILLSPWSRLTRGSLVLDAGAAIVWLEEGRIRRVEAKEARGSDRHNGRQVEYAAEQLFMDFADDGAIEKINGERNARLVSTSPSARTTVTANRLDLIFQAVAGDSVLEKALALQQGSIESKPLPARGGPLPETKILRSEVIELKMRPGGREIDSVATQAPGRIEFLPNHPGQRRRQLDGERITILYGEDNRIQSFAATTVSTRTEPPPSESKKPPVPLLTWSKDLKAAFDAAGNLARLEQWGDFRYEEGDRKGRAQRALLDAAQNSITLVGEARLWDVTGSLSAKQIALDQATGDVMAEGNVATTRAPEQKKNASPLLSGDAALHATARRMSFSDGNRLLRFEGDAVLWQGGNRIRADWIEIDRKDRKLHAKGKVSTQFLETPASQTGARAANGPRPAFTIVHSEELSYAEESRLALFRGGVKLLRAGVEVRSPVLRAHLAEKDGATTLEKAYADGGVEIVQASAGRTRKGAAEHAEYHAAEQKIVLHGGAPVFADSLRGTTRGKQLTWFTMDDRLLVEGEQGQPAVSSIRRR